MDCPKCQSPMEKKEVEGIEVDRCANCGGLWFDTREAESLAQANAEAKVDPGKTSRNNEYDLVDEINCPRCGDQMERHFDMDGSQIWYEVCPAHGKFFDAGEFPKWVQGQEG